MPIWPHTRVTGLFDAQTDIAVIKQILRQVLSTQRLPECCLERLEERDWVRAWMDDFHPMRFGTRLWVCPSHQSPPEPTAINVMLDPGLAFGTGTHPTTALCLTWLDGVDLEGQTVIDYGCGSGILAIAAAKLGAGWVWAVDIDPQALLACDDNAADNGVAGKVTLCEPTALSLPRADSLIANILAGPLIQLAPRFARLLKPGGRIALSGILDYQAGEVESAYGAWFDFGPSQWQEGWALLQGVRRR
jgi:ribosomal protein L11 methyltransferase